MPVKTYKYIFPTEEYAELSKEYTPIETYKYVFPIEEYVTISKKYNDKRKYPNSKLQKTISMKKNLKQVQMLLVMKMK